MTETEVNHTKQYFQTKLGKIIINTKQSPTPCGYRMMTTDECRWIKLEFISILKKLQYQNIRLQNGVFVLYHHGNIVQTQYKDFCHYSAWISPEKSSLNIKYFENYTQLIKRHKHLLLPIGLVLIVMHQIPEGFVRMKLDEGKMYKEELTTILLQQSIVGFDKGCLDGLGQEYVIYDECAQTIELFVVSQAPLWINFE